MRETALMRARIGLFLLVGMVINSVSPVRAADSYFGLTQPPIEIHGFGTVAASLSTTPYYIYYYDTTGKDLDTSTLTRAGLNIHGRINDEWSASLQLFGRANQLNFADFVDWGFVAWTPVQEYSLRFGRYPAPIWLFSQQIKVGLSYPWILPPTEIYSMNPINSVNGVWLLTRNPIGRGTLQFELAGGQGDVTSYNNDPNSPSTQYTVVKNGLMFAATYDIKEKYLFRMAVARATASSTVTASRYSASGNAAFPYVNNNLVKVLDLGNGTGRFFSLGAKIDLKNWLVLSEFARRLIDGSAITRASGAYVTVGRRLGRHRRVMPHITYSTEWDMTGSFWIHPNYPYNLTTQTSGNTWTFGLNYQPIDSVDFKIAGAHSEMHFVNAADNLNFNTYRVAVDFVF